MRSGRGWAWGISRPSLWQAILCLCASVAVGPGRAFGAAGPADLLLLHGKIITVDSRFSTAQAVAVEQGRIAAVGTDAQVQAYVGPRTRVVDLHGRTVIPGLIDSHIHAIRQGLTWDYEAHWQTATSLAQGLKALRDMSARTPPGTWVIVPGGWHESQFAENRRPTIEEVQAVSGDHPVWVQYLNDGALVNQTGLRALGISAETKNFPGCSIAKDAAGQPTGVLEGAGCINPYLFAKISWPSLDKQISSSRDWFRELNRLGLTDLGDTAGGGMVWPADYRAATALHDRGELTVRLHYFVQPNGAEGELPVIRRFVAAVRPGRGDDMMRPIGIGEQAVGAVSDGNPLGPLPPQFSQKGLDDWRTAVRIIIESGWRFQAHASRNHSVEQMLGAVEEINREIPVTNRRLAWAHVEDMTLDTARRVQAIGGGITFQDRLIYTGDVVAKNWPEDVYRHAPPLKTMLAMGVHMGGGTDSTQRAPYNPFYSMWWMITGKTIAGHPIRGPQENLSRLQALRLYTMGSAWFNMDEDRVGSIETGKYADLVVLSGDFLTVSEDAIKSLQSVLTIVGGNPVYAAGDYRSLVSR